MVSSVLDRIDKKQAAAWLLLGIVAVIIGTISLNYVWSEKPGVDSGIFATTGLHLLHGKTLYVEIWDNKPPLVYLMNAMAMGIGGENYTSIRQMERIFSIAGALTIILLMGRMFGSVIAAAFGLIVYTTLLYAPLIFESGNLTEEYCAPLWLMASLFALESVRSTGRRSVIMAGVSGLFISLTLLLKEPFLMAMFPVLGYIAFAPRHQKKFHGKAFAAFIAGVGVPGFIMLAWLWCSGAMPGWIDVISYNLGYSAQSVASTPTIRFLHHFVMLWQAVLTHSWLYVIALVPFLISMAHRSFVTTTFYAPWFIGTSLVFNFIGVNMSGRYFGHYYMQMVPSLALAAGCSIAFVGYVDLEVRKPAAFRTIVVCIVLVAIFVDRSWMREIGERWTSRRGAGWMPGPVDMAIRNMARPGDALWVNSGLQTYHYIGAGLVSPTPYMGIVKHWFAPTRLSTAEEKIAGLQRDLTDARPAFLVINDSEATPLSFVGLTDWVAKNYRDTGISEANGKSRLYLRNDRL